MLFQSEREMILNDHVNQKFLRSAYW